MAVMYLFDSETHSLGAKQLQRVDQDVAALWELVLWVVGVALK